MPVIYFCMKKNKDLSQSMIYMYHCFISTAFSFDTQNYYRWIIFYAQPLHCIRYQRKLKAATAMVYGEYEISEAYKDLSFFFYLVKYNQDGCKPNGLNWRLYVFRARKWYAEDPGSRDQSTCLWKVSEPMLIDSFIYVTYWKKWQRFLCM